jgi:hypothetical protein
LTVSTLPTRTEDQLSPSELAELDGAYRRLEQAVADYQRFLGGPLRLGEPVPVHDATEMAQAQADVEVAEAELWRLREQLLGWTRPGWAPPAALVADWFSPEDAVYDEADPRHSA